MNKIVFLDIDGVLTTRDTSYFTDNYSLNMENVERAKRLLDSTGAKLVWSTNWRGVEDGVWVHDGIEVKSLFPIAKQLFKDYEFEVPMKRNHGYRKYVDIIEWLRKNMWAWSDFAIIDDQGNQLLERFGENFFRTDFDVGLTDADVFRIEQYLKEE